MTRQEKPLQNWELKNEETENGELETMLVAGDTQNLVENIFSSYETRIQCVEALFQTTQKVLQGFHDSVLDTKQEREQINGQLKENLAKNGSLRKKDFDKMMSQVSSHQDQCEQEVRNLSKEYLDEQTNLVHELKQNLANFKDALTKGEAQRVKEFHAMITEILSKQEQRKNEVADKLKKFQKEQHETAKMLKELLAKGRELRVRDLKAMLAGFKIQHKERITQRKERKEEVQNMLGGFKKERSETAVGVSA